MKQMNDVLDRHDKMQRLNVRPPVPAEADIRPMSVVALVAIGIIAVLVMALAVRSCERTPQTAHSITGDVNCQYCHGVRLDNAKRYSKYWKARKSVDHTRLVAGRDDEVENDRMMKLILGGKP
jgi:hypothetical protein